MNLKELKAKALKVRISMLEKAEELMGEMNYRKSAPLVEQYHLARAAGILLKASGFGG